MASAEHDALSQGLRRVLEDVGSKDVKVRDDAARSLSKMGEMLLLELPALICEVQTQTSALRVHAALAIGGIGAKAAPAVPALIEALGDEDRELSNAATTALVNIGKPAVDDLAKALKDSSVNVEAMMVLGKIGAPAAASAVTALQEALTDLSSEPGPLKFMAAAALCQAGGPKKSAWQEGAEVLREGFQGPDAYEAMGALRFVPTAAAVPALLEQLSRDNEEIRTAAMEGLECVGGEAVPLLIQALEASSGKDSRVFTSIAGVLERIGKFSDTAVPMLMQKVLSGTVEQRCAALRILGGVGERAKPVVVSLDRLARDEDIEEEVRECAKEAIRMIEK